MERLTLAQTRTKVHPLGRVGLPRLLCSHPQDEVVVGVSFNLRRLTRLGLLPNQSSPRQPHDLMSEVPSPAKTRRARFGGVLGRVERNQAALCFRQHDPNRCVTRSIRWCYSSN